MERDLLYRYFDGDDPDEERRIIVGGGFAENYRLYLEERRLWCALLLHAGRRTARRPALWRRLAAWRVSGAAACILLLVGLAGIFFAGRMVPDGRMQQVVVPAGQRVELRLADGTKGVAQFEEPVGVSVVVRTAFASGDALRRGLFRGGAR